MALPENTFDVLVTSNGRYTDAELVKADRDFHHYKVSADQAPEVLRERVWEKYVESMGEELDETREEVLSGFSTTVQVEISNIEERWP